MGLTASHYAWIGTCKSFNDWRSDICRLTGHGNLNDYKGYGGSIKISKISICDYGLRRLFLQPDNEGIISANDCLRIADSLTNMFYQNLEWELLRFYHFNVFKDKTFQFIEACLLGWQDDKGIEFS